MGRLDGKVAVITGGASGMGAATARLFVSEGARVVIGDIQVDRAAAVAGELGKACVAIPVDVTSSEDVQSLVRTAMSEFGRLDIVYNNAGGGPRPESRAQTGMGGAIADMSEAAWDATVDLNLKSVFLGMKHALPLLIANGGGSIISTASVSAFMGMRGQGAYGAAKGGVVQLTRVCAVEYADQGIRANCICPGATLTPLLYDFPGRQQPRDEMEATLKVTQPIPRAGLAEDIANAALWLASDESSFVTGQAIVVDGGWMASARQPGAGFGTPRG
ncbi:MAG: SDR family NAD(P)-dependent oxidoreductase [Chloroflexi bacterium]|nr:SDR family NAD(P)-dependent oxidoreductase [Chloroflexota bacterium]